LLYFQPHGRGTSIAGALEYLERVLHRRSVVFMLSDFLDADYQRALQLVARRHDLIAVNLVDPRERQLPDVGFISLQDAESGRQLLVDTRNPRVRERFAEERRGEEEERSRTFRKLGIDEIFINSAESYIEPLVQFFRTRMRRL